MLSSIRACVLKASHAAIRWRRCMRTRVSPGTVREVRTPGIFLVLQYRRTEAPSEPCRSVLTGLLDTTAT